MADAAITAVSLTTGEAVRRAVSDADGRYVMTDLAPGTYDVRFEHAAFRSVIERLQIGAAANLITNARLLLGSVNEAITILAQRSETPTPEARIERARTLVEAQLLDRIARDPQTASNYLELAGLYYLQERFTESDDMVTRAVDLLDRGAASQPVMSVTSLRGGDVREPRKIKDVRPIYPAAALATGDAGVVVLEAKISEAGTVKDVRILRSVPLLDQAALGAVRQWLFTPTLLNGTPTEVLMTVTMNFTR